MTTSANSTPWFDAKAAAPQASVRLVCFPHAGASAFVFRGWHALMPPWIGVVAMQLPGRGERLREAPVRRLGPLLGSASAALMSLLDRPLALFGHSVGALIAFELARLLEREHARPPVHLFVSGRGAPDLPGTRGQIYNLPRAAFVAALRDFDATLCGLLDDPEALELFLPILRADLELSETYRYRTAPALSCPITVFGGDHDRSVPPERLDGWRRHTARTCTIRVLPGDHFFITTDARPVVRTIQDALRPAAVHPREARPPDLSHERP